MDPEKKISSEMQGRDDQSNATRGESGGLAGDTSGKETYDKKSN